MRGLLSIVAVAIVALAMLAGDAVANGPRGNGGFRGQGGGFRNNGGNFRGNFNGGFRNNNFRGNNFNRGFAFGVPFGVNRFNAFGVNRFNQFGLGGVGRFNTFGTRTVTDQFGNVFQVDAFGNSVFVGNAARGFGVNQFGGFGGRGFSFGFGY